MSKKLWIYLGIFAVLLGGFYLFIFAGTDMWQSKLPVINYTKSFSFTDQNGRRINEEDVKGKVHVVEYFFTTCTGICPRMNGNLKGIHQKYLAEPDFMILSHTVDPDKDSVGRMKQYADSLGVKSKNWLFLTGPKDSLYTSARVSYLLDDPANSKDDLAEQFIHTQFFALVDKAGRVRAIYDGLKADELKKMETDIDDLLKEKAPQQTFVNSLFNNNPS